MKGQGWIIFGAAPSVTPCGPKDEPAGGAIAFDRLIYRGGKATMQSWRTTLGLWAAALACLGGVHASAHAQIIPPAGGAEYSIPSVNTGSTIQPWPARWEASLAYTYFWLRTPHFPVLATTGSTSDAVPGGLGQPNTTVLVGDLLNSKPSPGFRATMTLWLEDPEIFCVDANFFMMEQRVKQQTFTSNANGSPVLSRPYFNPVTQTESADPRARPGTIQGSMMDSVTTQLMGAEANLKIFSPSCFQEGYGINFFGGFRWVRFQEQYQNFDTANELGGGGSKTNFSDTFTTDNQFFGGQLGSEVQYKFLGITFGILGKIAVGPNNQTIQISGHTTQTNLVTGAVTNDNQGIYAQPSNVGTYQSTIIAVMPEVAARMQFELTNNLRIKVSYSYMTINNIVRPGDQLNRNINIQPLGSGGGFAPALPPPPTFNQTSFYAQMLNFALELRY